MSVQCIQLIIASAAVIITIQHVHAANHAALLRLASHYESLNMCLGQHEYVPPDSMNITSVQCVSLKLILSTK